ncbi:MAG: right-handed parallel beta-helix repeat-containing protein, partial [Phycisphaerae bacterium]|nr:right-handed parallel beta-helix repeat-containing protein [Phycisphaerae bacterium]
LNNGKAGVEMRGGIIAFDYQWLKALSPYTVTANVNVYKIDESPRLTIEPGTQISFAQQVGLYIGSTSANYGGCLTAAGTEDDSIRFTAATGNTNGWYYLYFYDGSDYLDSVSTLKYCVIEEGGYSNNPELYIDKSNKVNIENTVIRDSKGYGVKITNSSPSLSDVLIRNNASYGISTDPNSLIEFSNIQLVDNGNAGVEVSGGTISFDYRWLKALSPYTVTSHINVEKQDANVRLTIEPGVEVQFTGSHYLRIGSTTANYGGCLTAVGTEDDSIRFTAATGNTNGWYYLLFENYSDYLDSVSTLKYCVIENGGYGNSQELYINSADKVNIENTVIRDSKKYGVKITNSTTSLSDVLIRNNASYGISTDPNSLIEFNNIQLVDNGKDGMEMTGGTINSNTKWYHTVSPINITGNINVYKANESPRL